MDLDAQASATKDLGVDIEERPSMADALLEPVRYPLDEVIVETQWTLT